jgi:hypothetical protein
MRYVIPAENAPEAIQRATDKLKAIGCDPATVQVGEVRNLGSWVDYVGWVPLADVVDVSAENASNARTP